MQPFGQQCLVKGKLGSSIDLHRSAFCRKADFSTLGSAYFFVPHRPLFRLLWAVWSRGGRAMCSRSISGGVPAASDVPHRPHLCFLWALWQHGGRAISPEVSLAEFCRQRVFHIAHISAFCGRCAESVAGIIAKCYTIVKY